MIEYLKYFGYYLWLAALWYISRRERHRVTVKERINNRTVTRYNWFFALLTLAPLIYFAGIRNPFFGDSYVYRLGFKNGPATYSEIIPYIKTIKKDRAFYFCMAVIRSTIGYRPIWYFLIIATVQGLLLTKTLRKYSTHFLMAMFIFYASTDYLSFMHNGLRQFVAVTIIFAASRFIFERRFIPAIIVILIASRFHGSALLMLPVIFIVQGEPWNKRTVLLLVLAMVAILYVNQFTNILDNMLEETQYTNVVSDWTEWNDDGTNPIRVAVYCVPAILSLIGINFIREADDPIINVCTNMSVISAGLFLISMATSGIFMGRLPIYVSLYANCILLPWEISHIFNNQSARIIKLMMVLLFLVFYYFQIHRTWGII